MEFSIEVVVQLLLSSAVDLHPDCEADISKAGLLVECLGDKSLQLLKPEVIMADAFCLGLAQESCSGARVMSFLSEIISNCLPLVALASGTSDGDTGIW